MWHLFRQKDVKQDHDDRRKKKMAEAYQALSDATKATTETALAITTHLQNSEPPQPSDALLVCDLHGKIEACNLVAEQVFGMTSEAMVGRPLREFMINPDYSMVDVWSLLTSDDCSQIRGVRNNKSFPIKITACKLDRSDKTVCLLAIREAPERAFAEAS